MSAPGQLFTRSDVAGLLEVPLPKLTWWAVASSSGKRYRSFEIQRRNGTARTIHAPAKPLKDIQRQLADLLLDWYEAPSHVHGFVRRRGVVSNTRAHRKRRWVLRVDLADFFPSINFGRVRGLFMAYPFEFGEDAATLMAQICCFDGNLPQGAPTSPVVSNFICHSLDRDLAKLALGEDCSVSRYADDLCISTDRTLFPERIAFPDDSGRTVVGEAMAAAVEGNGFTINPEKTRLMKFDQRQRVTGLVVNEKTNVPRHYVRALRDLLYIWGRYGEADAIAAWQRAGNPRNLPPGKPPPEFARVVRGQVQYVGAIKGWTSSTYLGLAQALNEVDPGFTLRHEAAAPKPEGQQQVRLFTEGESDVPHLLAAQRWFHERGEFTRFELAAVETYTPNGDDLLLRTCEAFSTSPQGHPCLFLFDTDKPHMVKKVVSGVNWKDWGNGVVSVALVDESGGIEGRSCIELLYDEATRQIEDENGRRVFLASEFELPSGHHLVESYSATNPQSSSLIREAVYEHGTKRSVALKKTDFARLVSEGKGPFAAVSFDSFRPTFEAISEAVGAAVDAIARQAEA